MNDGSVKHAIVSGRAALTQNTAKTVAVSLGTPASGTALTASSIQARPERERAMRSHRHGELREPAGEPRAHLHQRPGDVECHYRANVGATLLSVWFHVRLFADGASGFAPSSRTATSTTA